ncbi:MAG: AtpZ/AtpI family protein [Alphaproteobacteria bacterium]|nr:AtpZ/AtpI family protein [Alphaproteobacteria bacterium]MCL2505576.1 AtpZ/AtpI family protein [Alphaproteobacteria bacterium]
MKNQNKTKDKFKDLESRINHAENKILKKDKKPSKNKYKYKYSFASVSYDLAGTTLGSLVIGLLLDHYFDTTPWLLVVMVLLGTASGILLLWKKQQEAEDKKDEM